VLKSMGYACRLQRLFNKNTYVFTARAFKS
jgi:hypothetical protein